MIPLLHRQSSSKLMETNYTLTYENLWHINYSYKDHTYKLKSFPLNLFKLVAFDSFNEFLKKIKNESLTEFFCLKEIRLSKM